MVRATCLGIELVGKQNGKLLNEQQQQQHQQQQQQQQQQRLVPGKLQNLEYYVSISTSLRPQCVKQNNGYNIKLV